MSQLSQRCRASVSVTSQRTQSSGCRELWVEVTVVTVMLIIIKYDDVGNSGLNDFKFHTVVKIFFFHYIPGRFGWLSYDLPIRL